MDATRASSPTTVNPTTARRPTAKPTAADPTTANPTTARRPTAKPTAADPTTASPTTARGPAATGARRRTRGGPAKAFVTAAAVALALSACSSGDGSDAPSASPSASGSTPAASPEALQGKSAQQILDASLQAAESADTVKVDITASTPQGTGTYALSLTDDGLTGELDIPDFGSVEVLVVGGSMYLKGGQDVYTRLLSAEVAPTVSGKWLKLPEAELVSAGLLPATDKAGILAQIIAPDKERKLRRAQQTKEFDGVACVGLRSDNGILWIADSEEPYPMAIEPTDGSAGGVRMSQWNQPVDLQAPPEGEVVDLTEQAQPGP